MHPSPLTFEKLEETIILADSVFPEDAKTPEGPEPALRASLDKNEYSWYYDKYNVDRLNYFVLIENNRVIGLTGLYTKHDEPNVVWLGWFLIHPEVRGKGYGHALLAWTIEQAKDLGLARFKLYTSTDPNEAAAQTLYEKNGFKVIEARGDVIVRERTL